MLKKLISIALSLCLIFNISVMAENTNATVDETAPEVSVQMHQGEQGDIGMPPSGEMPSRGTPPGMPNGEMPPKGMNKGQRPSGEFMPPQGEFTPPQNDNSNNNAEGVAPQTDGNASAENTQTPSGEPQFGGQMPEGMGGFPGNMQNFNGQTQETEPMTFSGFVKTNSTPITSAILLALAFVFVIFYRRKNY